MSTKLRGARTRHLSGWSGGLVEGAEPDIAHLPPFGSLAGGLNVSTAPLGRLAVRGGSQVKVTFAEGTISDVLGIWPFSPTGAIAIAYDATADKHYAYALTDELEFALGSPVTEADSRVDLAWNTATAGRPIAVELFEKLYVADASVTGRREFVVLSVVGGALTKTLPTYNLGGTGPDPAYPFTLAVYNSSLFLAGWDSDASPDEPHFLRNSLIGTPPENAAGFDPEGYAIIGAHGQRITALSPGREILLVAKAGELHRVYGSGQALPGWHYAVQGVENTRGFGVLSPYALTHVTGFWYGIGKGGPFRTDGTTVDPLGIPWRQSWQNVGLLDQAWVTHHPDPDRLKVWFGLHENGFSEYAAAPFSVWTWDIHRETWSPPHRYRRSFHLVNCVIPGTTDAPAGVPTVLEQRFDYGEWGFASVAGRFVSADLDATTEVWGRTSGGAYTLRTALPAGIQRFHIGVTAGAVTAIKLRHNKGGVVGAFTGAVNFYPRVPAPTLSLFSASERPHPGVLLTATVFNPLAGSTLTVQPSTGAWSEEFEDAAVGSFEISDIGEDSCITLGLPDTGTLIQAQLEHPSWPLGRESSRITEQHSYHNFCGGAVSVLGPIVRQKLEDGGMQPTTITVTWLPQWADGAWTYRLEYKLASDSTWTTHSTTTMVTGVPSPMLTSTISGLTPGRKYHVRVVLTRSGTTDEGDATDCFTQLPVPTQVLEVIGSAGSPNTRLTLTAPYNGAAIASFNARETYLAVYTSQPGTPVAYETTAGTCGRPDRFFARTYDETWPDGFRYSDLVTDDIADPCTP